MFYHVSLIKQDRNAIN